MGTRPSLRDLCRNKGRCWEWISFDLLSRELAPLNRSLPSLFTFLSLFSFWVLPWHTALPFYPCHRILITLVGHLIHRRSIRPLSASRTSWRSTVRVAAAQRMRISTTITRMLANLSLFCPCRSVTGSSLLLQVSDRGFIRGMDP